MIKKNTKVIFLDGNEQKEDEMIGGMPLSVGEIVRVHSKDSIKAADYEVVEKTIDYYLDEPDQMVDIIYSLKRKD